MRRRKRALRPWVRENRGLIDTHVITRTRALKPTNDDEREDWVLNDEDLYRLALSQGVDI